jgi:hypothetical protein
MFDYVFMGLKDGNRPACPYCGQAYSKLEASLNGEVDLWLCGTIADTKKKWYRSMDCWETERFNMHQENKDLRAEVERLRGDFWIVGISMRDVEAKTAYEFPESLMRAVDANAAVLAGKGDA